VAIAVMRSVQQEIGEHIWNNRRGRKVEIVCDINFAFLRKCTPAV